MDLLRSKKFQAAILSLIVAIVTNYIPELDEASLTELVGGLWLYIIGQGIADFRKEAAKIEKQ